MHAPAQQGHRQDIEGLRALAVLLVIVHHVAPSVMPGGFVGVDVFFGISGYLMTGILSRSMHDGSYRYVDFLWKRCRRIIPPLLAVLTATLVAGACIMTGPELVSLARHTAAGSLSASNLLLWSEVGYFDTSAAVKPLLHLWSLGVEEQFYLLWPLLLAALPRKGRSLILAVAALGALSLLVSEELAYSNPSSAFYLLHSRAWELCAGAIVALLVANGAADTTASTAFVRVRTAMSCIGIALIAASAWRTSGNAAWPGITALAPVLGTALVLAAGPTAIGNRTLLSNRLASWIGERSYALYLWHWPPLAFLHIIAAERAWNADTLALSTAAAMILVFVVAHVTVLLIERPARHRATRLASSVRITGRHLIPYGAALGAFVVVAAVVIRTHGLPIRYGTRGTNALALLEDASADSITAYGAQATRCRLPDKGNATWCWRVPGEGDGIAVFGDSHAEVLFAGLTDLPRTRPLFLTGRKGCAPILQAPIDNRLSEICRRASHLAHAAIIADTSISTVILVSRGPAYIAGAGFGVDTQRPVVPVAMPRAPRDTLALHREFERALDASVRGFLAAGKRVVLVVGVPELGFLPEGCLIGRPLGLRALRSPCAVARSRVDERNREYRELVHRIRTSNQGLELLDAQELFCDAVLCHARQNGRLLYQDGNHLTLTGSRLVTERLRQLLTLPPRHSSVATADIVRRR